MSNKRAWYNNGESEKLSDSPVPGYTLGRLHKISAKKQAILDLAARISKEEFIEYFSTHHKSEAMKYFNISNSYIFDGLKNYYGYVKEKPTFLPESHRTKESYEISGKKSSITQRQNWQNKSEEQKQAWRDKQKKAHNTDHFRKLIKQINIDYQNNLTAEQKAAIRLQKSISGKQAWSKLNPEQRAIRVDTQITKCADTCEAKYGVSFPCMRDEAKMHGNQSKPNSEFAEELTQNHIEYTREFPIDRYQYDFKVNNILIEIDPTITHNINQGIFNHKGIDKYYHKNKSDLAKKSNFRCIHVYDWDDKAKIISLLKVRPRIYARNCLIKEIDSNKARDYLNQYHLQCYIRDDIRLGLYYNDTLVSVMTFGKPRYNKNYDYELLRYCSNYQVVGGAEKLFRYFLTTYNPKSVISYCDESKFTGEIYLKLGFRCKNSAISKHWYNLKTKTHVTDNLLRARGFDQLFGTNYGKGSSNEDLMREHNFLELYDAGQATYVYEV